MNRYIADFERPIVELEARLEALKKNPSATKKDIAKEIAFLENQIAKLKLRIYSNLTPWQKVNLARHPARPRFSDYLNSLFSDFLELHGDRLFGDDAAVIGGFAYLDGLRVMVVGTEKGKNTKEKVHHNFGMPHPEGYRKAARMFRLAEKFKLPVVNFIDTPGAYPGIEAEERGQAIAIAENLKLLSGLGVPVITVNIGEGGSGGALALGVADRVFMLENAYYSVIAPEGCASILWGDASQAEEAASTLRLTAEDLLRLSLIDGIIEEPLGGAHHDILFVSDRIKSRIVAALTEIGSTPVEKMIADRYQKLRRIGVFSEDKFFELAEDIKLIRSDKYEDRSAN